MFKFIKTFKNVKTQLLSHPRHIHTLIATRGQKGPYWTAQIGMAPPSPSYWTTGTLTANSSRALAPGPGQRPGKARAAVKAGRGAGTVWQEAPQTFYGHVRIPSYDHPDLPGRGDAAQGDLLALFQTHPQRCLQGGFLHPSAPRVKVAPQSGKPCVHCPPGPVTVPPALWCCGQKRGYRLNLTSSGEAAADSESHHRAVRTYKFLRAGQGVVTS